MDRRNPALNYNPYDPPTRIQMDQDRRERMAAQRRRYRMIRRRKQALAYLVTFLVAAAIVALIAFSLTHGYNYSGYCRRY